MALSPSFSRNPSRWGRRLFIFFFAAIACSIATYLGLYQWHVTSSVWDPVFGHDTEQVLTSNVSYRLIRWLHIPDAVLGAFAYLGDMVFVLAGSKKRWMDRPWIVLLFGLDVIPVCGVSIILVILQGTVVGAWCFLCLINACVSLILICLSYDEVRSCLTYLRKVKKQAKSLKILWNTFWGRPSEIAYQVSLELEGRG